MRRGPGVAGLMKRKEATNNMGAVGEQLEETKVAHAKAQLQSLRTALSDFAQKHRNRINSEPQFRQAFCEMCVAAGVDPLASSKGLWDELLGVGHFYNELAVQVLTACLRTRDVNGGLLDIHECLRLVQASRPAGQAVDADDVQRAVSRLSALGRGVGLRSCGGRRLLYSVPDELSGDPAQALEVAARAGGHVSSEELQREMGWSEARADAALAHFVREGLCWVDAQDPSTKRRCWFPSIALAGAACSS
uniref:Vacuolar-sorting protein SNF8 n=1 Tax=Alexandrium catenella TaxID=2925 RepID=A0A7S1VYZ2_ALECA|mmetsp:Transcript_33307/g.90192  ORF Transcript_33307/g.90192 Transcript_33307/m.90192 type:complete len:249 (+) Transcript_33307:78-824(+)